MFYISRFEGDGKVMHWGTPKTNKGNLMGESRGILTIQFNSYGFSDVFKPFQTNIRLTLNHDFNPAIICHAPWMGRHLSSGPVAWE